MTSVWRLETCHYEVRTIAVSGRPCLDDLVGRASPTYEARKIAVKVKPCFDFLRQNGIRRYALHAIDGVEWVR